MGFAHGTLPAGVGILGRPFSEPTLFKLAYSYERATKHRPPPPGLALCLNRLDRKPLINGAGNNLTLHDRRQRPMPRHAA
jgi:hypothetical protein